MEFFRNLFNKKRRSQVAFWDLVERAEDHLRQLDAVNQMRWKLAEAPRVLDAQTGIVTFGSADQVYFTAQAQVIGTLSQGRPVWRWAWDSNSVPTSLTRSANIAKSYGELHGLSQLTTAHFNASLTEAWGLVALTCLLTDAQGAYCEQTEQGLVFFVFRREALGADEAGPFSALTSSARD